MHELKKGAKMDKKGAKTDEKGHTCAANWATHVQPTKHTLPSANQAKMAPANMHQVAPATCTHGASHVLSSSWPFLKSNGHALIC